MARQDRNEIISSNMLQVTFMQFLPTALPSNILDSKYKQNISKQKTKINLIVCDIIVN